MPIVDIQFVKETLTCPTGYTQKVGLFTWKGTTEGCKDPTKLTQVDTNPKIKCKANPSIRIKKQAAKKLS